MPVAYSSEENFMDTFIPTHTPMDHKFTFKSRPQPRIRIREEDWGIIELCFDPEITADPPYRKVSGHNVLNFQ